MSPVATSVVPAIVGGADLRPGAVYETTDPATGEPTAAVADCGPDDVDKAVEAAAAAATHWAAAGTDLRRAVLVSATRTLQGRRAELIELAVHDAGALRPIATSTQVDAAISRMHEWSTAPDDLLEVRDPGEGAGLRGALRRVPSGVVACISPYNFPLLAMVGKVVPALFAGNPVVMKPAPQDPLLVGVLAEALRDALAEHHAPAGAVNLLTGAGAELGAALVRHPDVRSVSFTGSTPVGVDIHRAAAPTMKQLLLELGGKGAVVVRRDADPAEVVAGVRRTWTTHSGQVCLTPARIIADAAVHDEIVEGLRAELAALRIGPASDPDATVGPLISAEQRARVDALVATAEPEGCTVERNHDLPDAGYFAAPALVTGAGPRSTVMQQEAFGPVLAVMRSSGDDEAVAAATSTPYALTDYVYSRDLAAAHAVADRLYSAQVGINTTRRHPGAPFGGNRASGVGRSGGAWSLEHCTTVQTRTEPVTGPAS